MHCRHGADVFLGLVISYSFADFRISSFDFVFLVSSHSNTLSLLKRSFRLFRRSQGSSSSRIHRLTVDLAGEPGITLIISSIVTSPLGLSQSREAAGWWFIDATISWSRSTSNLRALISSVKFWMMLIKFSLLALNAIFIVGRDTRFIGFGTSSYYSIRQNPPPVY